MRHHLTPYGAITADAFAHARAYMLTQRRPLTALQRNYILYCGVQAPLAQNNLNGARWVGSYERDIPAFQSLPTATRYG